MELLRRIVTGGNPPGRLVSVRSADSFIVSYPRSGNTWVRFLVYRMLAPQEESSFRSLQGFVPDIYKVPRRAIDAMDGGRILKSHEPFDPRYPRVLYLVRDPRAVAVSYFYYQQRAGLLDPAQELQRFVDAFVRGAVDGFGTWQENVESWLSTRGTRDSFLLIRYEDLLARPHHHALRIAEFLRLSPSEEVVRQAVQDASFKSLLGVEKRALDSVNDPNADPDITFMRKGSVDAWTQEMDPAVAALIEREFGATMQKLDYL